MAKKTTNRENALIRVVKVVGENSAKAIMYTTALLGIASLMPSSQIPPELIGIATGLGIQSIGSILDRVISNENISDEEIIKHIDMLFSSGGIEKLLTKEHFYSAFRRLRQEQNKIADISKTILENLKDLESSIVPAGKSAISYSEARQIAQDVFDANFYKLIGEANEKVHNRIDELVNMFIMQLKENYIQGFTDFSDPDFQYALITGQRIYAKTGSPEIRDVIIDVLVERAAKRGKKFTQLVQSEALETISKLTIDHLNILSIVFLRFYATKLNHDRLDLYVTSFRKEIVPFLDNLEGKDVYFYGHLLTAGCLGETKKPERQVEKRPIPVSNRAYGLYDVLREEEVEFLVNENVLVKGIFVHGKYGYYVYQKETYSGISYAIYSHTVPLDNKELIAELNKLDLTTQEKQTIIDTYENRVRHFHGSSRSGMPWITLAEPKIATFDEILSNVPTYNLTPVGIVLAISNIKRVTGEKYNIANWIEFSNEYGK